MNTPQSDPTRPWRMSASAGAALAALMGQLALMGWDLQADALTSFGRSFIPMAPNTALLFLVLGLALAVRLSVPASRAVDISATLAALGSLALALLTLLDPLLPLDVDRMIFQTDQTLGAFPVGVMSPVTAVLFGLSAAAMLVGPARITATCLLGLAVSGTGQIFAVGYLYQTPLLYSSSTIPLALPTALAFAALGGALAAGAGPQAWPLRLLVGPSVQARLLRWILPPIPLLMLVDDAFKALLGGPLETAEALLTTASTVVSLVLVGLLIAFSARHIGRRIEEALARQKLAEDALRESEAALRTLFEQAAVGVSWLCPETGRLGHFNDKLCALYQRGPEEMRALDLRGLFRPEARAELEERLALLRQGEAADFSLEAEQLRGDGSWAWMSLTISRGRVLAEAPERLILVAQDITGRKQAERFILEAKNEWERTFDTITDLIFLVDTDNRIIRVNAALGERLGLAPREEVGRGCAELLGLAEGSCFCALDGENSPISEIGFANIPGSFLGSRSVLRNAQGEVYGCVYVVSDITTLKRTQQALADIEQTYRRMVENAVVGVFQSTLSGQVVSSNPAMARMFGYASPEQAQAELTDLGRQAYARPQDRQRLLEALQREGMVRDFEVEMRRRDGSSFWARLSCSLQPGPDGQQRLEGFLQDITAWKLASDRLAESERRFREVVETMAQGLVQVDALGLITYCNPHFCEIMGRARDDILGRRPEFFLDPGSLAGHRAALSRMGQAQAPAGHDAAWLNADGNKVFTIISPLTQYAASGACKGYWLLVMDVTERRLLESQLMHSQKLEAIGQLAAGIAHEINTPAQYVGNNVQFLQEASRDMLAVCRAARELAQAEHRCGCCDVGQEAGRGDRLRELDKALKACDVEYLEEEVPGAIAQTREGVERISTIVRSVKQFAHPGESAMAPADLNEAMRSTATVSRNEWKYVAELVTDLDPDLPPVVCMIGEINQVVLNLIVNAAHAIDETQKAEPGRRGLITLATRRSGPWAEIRVTDTGAGIPEHVQGKIFDPFFTTKEVGRGTGQGLTISRSIVVEKHGGQLFFETEPGRGTTFVVRLPLKQTEA